VGGGSKKLVLSAGPGGEAVLIAIAVRCMKSASRGENHRGHHANTLKIEVKVRPSFITTLIDSAASNLSFCEAPFAFP
jgi:hypothetical protein